MNALLQSIFCCLLAISATQATLLPTTGDRIGRHGYAWQKHTVQTIDGYLLTVFRMQRSSLPNNQMESNKSAVLLMHCLLCSSDTWVLNGPNDGLAYMLADAGHDVWLGNARGNGYSQNHIYKSPLLPSFWEFSWHEIGVSDIPAMIDYITLNTGENAVHYVGHSQGSTALMVMLSSVPSYNDRIKTAHLLAPPIYMENMRSPAFNLVASLIKKPGKLSTIIGTSRFIPGDDLIHLIAPTICKEQPIQDWCNDIVILFCGGETPYTNMTLFPSYLETHPSAASVRQLLHYGQGINTGEFRQFDYGALMNYLEYGTAKPPLYPLENVNTAIPINLYFSDNDDCVAVEDVQRLASVMDSSRLALHHVVPTQFNHLDYTTAWNVKDVINNCIVDKVNESEDKPFNGNLCNFR